MEVLELKVGSRSLVKLGARAQNARKLPHLHVAHLWYYIARCTWSGLYSLYTTNSTAQSSLNASEHFKLTFLRAPGVLQYHHVIYIATTSGRLDDDEPVDIHIAQEKSKDTLVVCISFTENLSYPTYTVETETRSEMVCKSPRASDCIIPWSFMSSSSSCQPYKARRPSLEHSLPLFICRYL
jgi:hypothetical protein